MKSVYPYCYLLLTFLLCYRSHTAVAQSLNVSNVGNNGNVSYLVQNVLVGGCLTVNNITYSGNANSIGYFNNATPIGITEGIILSSGNVNQAGGLPNSFANTSYFGAGDADLNALPGSTTQDAAIIEFDFLPLSSSVSFDFIFASEEYPEFVGTTFNDVFGFFVSGPGIAGQQNIALVPGTTTPITINTINAITNSQYYTPNIGTTTQYDGYTKVLTAVMEGLTPCQSYHIKLALADAGDAAYDSAVFLAANSFNAGQSIAVQAFVPSTNSAAAYEGCQDGYFIFTRPSDSDLSEPLVIPLLIDGTAQPNVDYDALPNQAVIQAGDTSVILPIIAYSDLFSEGEESIIVTPDMFLCNCQQPTPDTLVIYDSPEIFEAASSSDPTICPGSGALIAIIAGGSQFQPYTYEWSNGASGPIIPVAPAVNTSYSVTVTDACGRSITQVVNVTVDNVPPTADISDVPPLCSADGAITLEVATEGGTFSGTGVNPTTGVFNPTNLNAGNYTISYNVSNNCGSDSDQITIVVDTPIPIVINPIPVQCANGSPLVLTANKPNGVWSGSGIVGGTNTTGQFDPVLAAQSPPPYIVTYTIAGSCGGSDDLTITVNPVPTITLSGGGTICNAGQAIPLQTSLTGVGPWQVGYTINNTTQNNITINNPNAVFNISGNTGTYNVVSVSDANGCVGNVFGSATISVSNLSATATATNALCFGSNGSIQAVPINGSLPYSYQWSNTSVGNTDIANNLPANTYTVTITDANNCTATTQATLTAPSALQIHLEDLVATCPNLNEGSLALSANGGTLPYTWSTGQQNTNNILLNNLGADSYDVLVTDANNCSSQTTVVVTNYPAPNTNITGQTLICENTSTTLCSQSPFVNYEWSSGQVDNCINTSITGTYTLTVTDINACTATASVTIQNDSFGLEISAFDLFCANEATGSISILPVGGTTPFSYVWNDNTLQGNNLIGLAADTYSVTVTDAIGCSQTSEMVIAAPAALTANISVQQAACNSTTANLTASASGGTSPYNFYWGNGLPEIANLSNVPAGVYTVTVSDAGNCTATQSVTVSANAALVLSATAISPACAGQNNGSIAISVTNGNAPYTFAWNNATIGNQQNPTNLTAGTYTVTVSDSNQCSATISATLVAPMALSLSEQHQNLTCFGANNGQININANGGTIPYSFAWNNAATNTNLNNLVAQTYTVTVTDQNNCSQSLAISLSSPNALQIDDTVVPIVCNGANTGSINLSVIGGNAPYAFLWNNGNISANVVNLSAQTYSVTVSDANQCTATASYILNQPTAINLSATSTNATCNANNGQIQLTANGGTQPYNYVWSNAAPNTNNPQNLLAGVYTVTVSDSNNCTASTTVAVANNNAPSISLLNQQNTTCGNANASLSISATGGTGNITLLWSNDSNSNTLQNLSNGVYSVTATDAANCQAIESFEIVGTASPQIIVANVENSTCGQSNGAITWTISGGTPPYQWQSPNDTWTQDQLAEGNYTLTITDSQQCSATASQNITGTALPLVENSNVIPTTCGVCNGSINYTINSTQQPLSYLWNDGNTTDLRTNLCADTYTVTITDNAQCTTTASFVIADSEPLSIAFGTTINPTCGQCNGQLGITINNPTSNDSYTYSWNNGAMLADIIDLCSNTYSVTVTNTEQCSATVTTNIAAADAPIINNATLTDENCGLGNGSISTEVIGGTGNLQYSWNNGYDTANITNLSAGTYTLTVTDDNSCSASQSFQINSTSSPTLSVVSLVNANCGQSNGSVSVAAADGSGTAYSFVWDTPNGNNETANNLAAGTYNVTVTDNTQCSATLTLAIGNEGAPSISVQNVQPSTCSNNNGAISISVTGGVGNLSYTWTDGVSNNATASNLLPAIYFVTVSDANNCQSIASAEVTTTNTPTLSINNLSPATCSQNNGAVSIIVGNGTAPFNWTWSQGVSNDSIANNLAPNNYVVTVTDAADCSATISLTITAETPPTISAITTTNATCGQNNGTISTIVDSPLPLTYIWSDNNLMGANPVDVGIGTYILTVSDSNACTATATATVSADNVPTLNNSNVTPTTCGQNNGAISLVINSPLVVNYVWSVAGESGSTLNNIAEGNYTVTVTDSNNCSLIVPFEVAGSQPISMTISSETTICGQEFGSVATNVDFATAPISYSWDNATIGNTSFVDNLAVGSYSVMATDANNCTATATAIVTGTLPSPPIWCNGSTESSLSFAWNDDPNANGYAFIYNNDTILTTSNSYTLNNLLPNESISVQLIALGDGLWCGDSEASTAECVTNNCPTIAISTGILDSIWCINEAPITVQPIPAGGSFVGNNSNIFDPMVLGVGSHTITYTYTDANACSYAANTTINIVDLPFFEVTAPDTVCVGDAINLNVGSPSSNTVYTWQWGSMQEVGSSFSNIANVSGNQTVVVTAESAESCYYSDTISFFVNQVSVSVGNDTTVLAGSVVSWQPIVQTLVDSPLSYAWSSNTALSCNDCPTPTAIITSTDTYTLMVTDEWQCQAADSMLVQVRYLNSLIIPTAFSPNNDNINDFFILQGHNISHYEVAIYDRWGTVVLEKNSTDTAQVWNGQNKAGKECELGVYVFYVKVVFDNGEEEFLKGNVSLIR